MKPLSTAFVMGAGLGTRLRPLTAKLPKPLIPMGGRPMITYALEHLRRCGVERFVINTHWCAERYAEFFPSDNWEGRPILWKHEWPEVLETGGGLWNARSELGSGSFAVYNGDILSDLPIEDGWKHHVESGNEVTLVLRSNGGVQNVLFEEDTMRILDLRRELQPAVEPRHSFTGIYFVEPEFLGRIPAETKVSVVPMFHAMIREGAKLGGICLDQGGWRDVGTRSDYLEAWASLGYQSWVAPGALVEQGAELTDSIIWSGGTVAAGARLKRCIVTEGAFAEGVHEDKDF